MAAFGDAMPKARDDVPALLRWAMLLAPLPWIVAHFLPPHNHDASAVLQFAQRWLAGERLYVDLIDVNPPLAFVLGLVPAAIARLAPISATAAMVGCTLLVVAAGFLLTRRLLAADPRAMRGDSRRLLLPPLYLCLTIVYPGWDFTQREHLMVAAALPYLVHAALRAEGVATAGRLTIPVALLAGVGFAIKPHYLAVPLLVEGWLLVARGPRAALRDPVPWTLAAVFGTYLTLLVTAFADYLALLPMIRDHYLQWMVPARRWQALFASPLAPTVAALALLAAASLRAPRAALPRVLVLAALGAALAALVQGKGWSNHVMPAEVMVVALAGVLLCDVLERLRLADGPGSPPGATLGPGPGSGSAAGRAGTRPLLAGFLLGAYYLGTVAHPMMPSKVEFATSQAGRILASVRQAAAGEPVLWLGTILYPSFPVLNYAGSTLAMRHMSLWLLQSVYAGCASDGPRFNAPARMPPAERALFESMPRTVARFQPRLIVLDAHPDIPPCGGRPFDYVDYFARHPEFAAQWSRYRPAGAHGRYRLFVRR
jgi:hypothetical protein